MVTLDMICFWKATKSRMIGAIEKSIKANKAGQLASYSIWLTKDWSPTAKVGCVFR